MAVSVCSMEMEMEMELELVMAGTVEVVSRRA